MARTIAPQLDSEVPQAFIQTAAPSKKVRRQREKARMAVNLVIAFMVMATLVNAISAVANYRTSQGLQNAAATSASPSFKSRYDILGAQVVEAWISGDQPMIDTIASLEWPVAAEDGTGIEVVSVGYLGGQTVSLEGTSDYHESLSYSVVAADGAQYVASLDMGVINDPVTGSVRPVLLSALFVEPRDAVNVIAGTGQPAWDVVDVGDASPLAGQIGEWVEAWVSNDAAALKALTGDSSDGVYSGLASTETWETVEGSVSVTWATVRPSDGLVVARVAWDMQTPAPVVDPVESGTAGAEAVAQKRVRQAVDLLVGEAESGLPKILAWGAPGAYADLAAYENAMAVAEEG